MNYKQRIKFWTVIGNLGFEKLANKKLEQLTREILRHSVKNGASEMAKYKAAIDKEFGVKK